MNIDIEVGRIEDIVNIDLQIPEFDGRTTAQKIQQRVLNRTNLILIAKVNNVPVAYKIGYEVSKQQFYSWLGGVIPTYRQQGVATKLREKQEAWALSRGYGEICVKSMNRYPAMLQLLITSGYQVSGYEDNGTVCSSKICFVKTFIND